MSAVKQLKEVHRGFDLGSLTKETKPLTMEFEGQELHVEYYPRAMKLKDILELPDPADQPAVVRFTAGVLARRLASWDLTDGGVPIGTEYDDLVELPPDLVNAVLEALNATQRVGEATGSN